eukprot:TRINITY_DN36952_c0_g1_i1.p1 TRINITY_DN36952_c0_g1~~TRINITY_DN36952_c0_g1_i1.p1  ORF type:complete len:259 (+),score=37.18 TRINITY_DN36952_c0_g1_i1:65-778(+)
MFRLVTLLASLLAISLGAETPLPTFLFEDEVKAMSILIYLPPSEVSLTKLKFAIDESVNRNGLVGRVEMRYICPGSCPTFNCRDTLEGRKAIGCVEADSSSVPSAFSTEDSIVGYFLVMQQGADLNAAIRRIEEDVKDPAGPFKKTGAVYTPPTPAPSVIRISLTADAVCGSTCKTIAIVCSIIGFLILIGIAFAIYCCCCKPREPQVIQVDLEAGKTTPQPGLEQPNSAQEMQPNL